MRRPMRIHTRLLIGDREGRKRMATTWNYLEFEFEHVPNLQTNYMPEFVLQKKGHKTDQFTGGTELVPIGEISFAGP